MNRRLVVLASVIGIAGAASTAPAETRYVPAQYSNIQAAMDLSAAGDTVLVAPGTYREWHNRVIDGFPNTFCVFMTDGVVLRSESGAEATVIDGGRMVGQLPNTVLVRNTSLPTTLIEGFTITTTGMQLPGLHILGDLVVADCAFTSLANPGSSGAGVNANGDVVLMNCEFSDCHAADGGAIYHANGTIEMTNCAVRQCGTPAVELVENGGGPLESVVIEGCLFEDNGDDGAIAASYMVRPVTIRNSVFRRNVENHTGGAGVSIGGMGPKVVEWCVFESNDATGANGTGGGVKTQGPATIRSNTFWKNGAYTVAGGSAVSCLLGTSGIVLENNILADGMGQWGAVLAPNVSMESRCNIFWNNGGGPSGEGYVPGPTDREIDPQLCAPDSGVFTVNSASPCLPENSLGCGLIGAFGPGCGTVSVESKSWGSIKGKYRNESEGVK